MTHWLDLSQVYGDSKENADLVRTGGGVGQDNISGEIKLVSEEQTKGQERNYLCMQHGCFWLGNYKISSSAVEI